MTDTCHICHYVRHGHMATVHTAYIYRYTTISSRSADCKKIASAFKAGIMFESLATCLLYAYYQLWRCDPSATSLNPTQQSSSSYNTNVSARVPHLGSFFAIPAPRYRVLAGGQISRHLQVIDHREHKAAKAFAYNSCAGAFVPESRELHTTGAQVGSLAGAEVGVLVRGIHSLLAGGGPLAALAVGVVAFLRHGAAGAAFFAIPSGRIAAFHAVVSVVDATISTCHRSAAGRFAAPHHRLEGIVSDAFLGLLNSDLVSFPATVNADVAVAHGDRALAPLTARWESAHVSGGGGDVEGSLAVVLVSNLRLGSGKLEGGLLVAFLCQGAVTIVLTNSVVVTTTMVSVDGPLGFDDRTSLPRAPFLLWEHGQQSARCTVSNIVC